MSRRLATLVLLTILAATVVPGPAVQTAHAGDDTDPTGLYQPPSAAADSLLAVWSSGLRPDELAHLADTRP
jgi:hypothetical protein